MMTGSSAGGQDTCSKDVFRRQGDSMDFSVEEAVNNSANGGL